MLEPALLRCPYQPHCPTTLHYPLHGGLMTTDSMDYLWDMFQLIRHNVYTGHHFFDNETKRLFKSRWQGLPPYGGRVFVTSEKPEPESERRYSVRVIHPDGAIETIKPNPPWGGFGYFATRYDAHRFAKAYAADNFVRGFRKGFLYRITTSERITKTV